MDPHSSFSEIADKRRRYDASPGATGFFPPDALFQWRASSRWAIPMPTPARCRLARRRLCRADPQRRPAKEVRDDRGTALVSHDVDQVVLHNTLAHVIDRIPPLRGAAGLDYLLCAPLSRQSFVMLTDRMRGLE